MPASKYEFKAQTACDHEIQAPDGGGKIGELRVKPSSILWKSKGQQDYRSISLDDFIKWIEAEGKLVSK